MAFTDRFGARVAWAGGQGEANTAALRRDSTLRRIGPIRPGENFEIGDLRCDLDAFTLVVEYESGAIAVHNLLKYWPYLRGDLSRRPSREILLCHFSDWVSYGSHRDLWQWLLRQMQTDPTLLVPLRARQFDHWGADFERCGRSITDALDWIEAVVR